MKIEWQWRQSLFAISIIGILAFLRPSESIVASVTRIIQQPVEQQTNQTQTVINPTMCPWDVDDQINIFGSGGTLASSEEWSVEDCVIEDTTFHLMYLDFYTKTNNPSFAVRIQVGDRIATANGTKVCLLTPRYRDLGEPLIAIEGSQGGYGLQETLRWSVQNTGAHTLRGVNVIGGVKGIGSGNTSIIENACPSGYAAFSDWYATHYQDDPAIYIDEG